MKKFYRKRVLSLALTLVILLVSLIIPTTVVSATEGEELTIKDGMVLSKTVEKVPGTDEYLIRLYAYSTGSSSTIETTVSRPVDVVLIVDQSSSMEETLSNGTSKLSATKTAVNKFIESIKDDAAKNKVNHRIALIGYSNGPDDSSEYNGTELFVGSKKYNYANSDYTTGEAVVPNYVLYNGKSNSTYYSERNNLFEKVGNEYKKVTISRVLNGIRYEYTYHFSTGNFVSQRRNTVPSLPKDIYVLQDPLASNMYPYAFQDVTTTTGYNNIKSSVTQLDSVSNTYPTAGIKMANGIFDAYKSDYESGERKKIIVFFTDGRPAESGSNDFLNSEGDSSIAEIKKAKDAGVVVYTVGVFSNADASTPESLPGNDSNINKSNRFLYLLSSYYPSASSMTSAGAINTNLKPKYYMTAKDTDALNSVFDTISQYIHTEYTEVKLTEKAQIKDVITPYFSGPTSVDDIYAYYQDCTGIDPGDNRLRTFNPRKDKATDLTIDIVNNPYDESGGTAVVGAPKDTVIVTDFNYRENWCGVDTNTGDPHGKRVVIEFTITVRDGFMGGNGVPTNEATSGLYDDDGELMPGYEFEVPEPQDVPIEDFSIKVNAVRKNVYLYGDLDANALKRDATIEIYDSNLSCKDLLKLDEENYGLPEWRVDHINVDLDYSNSSFKNLTKDTSYYISGTVAPTTTGAAVAKNAKSEDTPICVYVPKITFKDSSIKAGESSNYSDNLASVEWVHKEKDGSYKKSDDMVGSAPSLHIVYVPEESTLYDDSHVKVSKVMMDVDGDEVYETDVTSYCLFDHQNCTVSGCTFDKSKENFIVHVTDATANLVIKNTVYTSEDLETKDDGNTSTFVYHITSKDGSYKQKVVVKGSNSSVVIGLPVGEYTVVQDTDWSSEYTCSTSAKQTKVIVGESSTDRKNVFEFKNYKKSNRNIRTAWNYVKNLFTPSGIVAKN